MVTSKKHYVVKRLQNALLSSAKCTIYAFNCNKKYLLTITTATQATRRSSAQKCSFSWIQAM